MTCQTTSPSPVSPISLHGGHSGEFCLHAEDSLEEIVAAYVARGIQTVGISEHMPPTEDRFLYPDEQAAGLTARLLQDRFRRYITTCRDLQQRYARRIRLLVGFETETYTGALAAARQWKADLAPDYLVGSVHHVNDTNFDFDPSRYRQAVAATGGIVALYLNYFDLQYDMIRTLRPAVVGHFDLVRLYDPEYRTRLKLPLIAEKVERNLAAMKQYGLLLDVNMRALSKGASEPYPTRDILILARKMGLHAVPGDDSHGVASVGNHLHAAVRLLTELGFDTRWDRLTAGIRPGTPGCG